MTTRETIEAANARCVHDALRARLRPFIARRVAPADVDDVLQDVFVRLQRSLPDLRDDDRFGPWVFQLARHAIVDHLRTRARHPIARGDAPEEPAPEADGDGDVASQLALYIGPFVGMLEEPYRTALTLTELEGRTQKEAAELLGISLSGMKSRVQRGRERLRALLEQCCEIALDARGKVIAVEPRPRG
ncbi:MAG: sigma-70 family RNA polymerase sigma factor [Polyangiaceae bacterium]